MSLTNPNKVVTEQRLNEYHNTILPYLGGMPAMVANKFSKGDLYSTDEKMIGQWIDGKPLYQKVINFTTPPSGTGVIDASDLHIDTFVSLEGMFIDGGGAQCPIGTYYGTGLYVSFAFYNDTFTMNVGNAYKSKSARAIIQYTKTTDSSISIGSDTDYSTEEKVVGTWIDGKPIYQKTFTELNIQLVFNSWVEIAQIPNVEKLIDIKLYRNLQSLIITGAGLECAIQDIDKIKVEYNLDKNIRTVDIATIQYTKTTD